jgi:hypothetical protein
MEWSHSDFGMRAAFWRRREPWFSSLGVITE